MDIPKIIGLAKTQIKFLANRYSYEKLNNVDKAKVLWNTLKAFL